MAETKKKIDIFIDGNKVSVTEDTFLLNAINQTGIKVPTLCHHKDLTPNGSCRLCTVEVEDKRGRKKLVTACNFPVRDDVKVHTKSERVLKHRKTLAEMYLGRWPNVPAIQQVAEICGATDSKKYESELTDNNPKACVLCGRCTRGCHEFTQEDIIDFAGRGIKRHMAMPFEKVDEHCISCQSCAYVCPTGAIIVTDDRNKPFDPIMIRNHGMKVNAEMATLDQNQCRMRDVGTANIVDVMDAYDLLPVRNYAYGQDPETWRIDSKMLKENYFKQDFNDACWPGCSMNCAKAVDDFVLRTGPYKGDAVTVDGPEYETAAGCSNMGCFDADFAVEFNFYCDTYGIDTISAATCVAFVMEAFEAGQITTEHTGGMNLKFGAVDEVLELLHQSARGKGFGVDVFKGIRYLKEKWVKEFNADKDFLWDIGMEVKGLEFSEYVCKESIAQQGGYTLAIKGPQHDEAWLIFMDMVNNQLPTWKDKAEALYYFPLWRTWFGLLGLCKLPWNDVVPSNNYQEDEPAKISDHVRNYLAYFEGMTGTPITVDDMLNQSARVYNFQKVMCRMLGYGTQKDDIPPYRAVGPVTVAEYESRAERYDTQLKEKLDLTPEKMTTQEKVDVLRKFRMEQYYIMRKAVYERRGWDENGVPTLDRLKELGIDLPELVDIVKNPPPIK